MTEKIVLIHTGQLVNDLLDVARRHAPGDFKLEILPEDATSEQVAEAIRSAQYLLGFVPWLSDELIASAGALKLVQLTSAGYDRVNIAGFARAGVPICTNGGANAVAVAEHTVLLILAVYRQLVCAHRSVVSGRWEKGVATRTLFELNRKTVGLVGLGRIGRDVAKRVRAFETEVLYTDIHRLPAKTERELGVSYVSLETLLERSDVVSLHIPLTDGTRGMIGKAALSRMKPSAILINTCRGGIIEEPALAEALRSGRLLGAGLDTLVDEPPDPANPLLRMDNVTLTPHIGGPTFDSFEKRFVNGYANIERVAHGERPFWIIPEMTGLKLSSEAI